MKVNMAHWWDDTDKGNLNLKKKEKPCLSATLSTTNLTMTDLGLNQDLRR
jgi:hypothetical protein